MTLKLLTEHHLEFLSLKKVAAKARVSLHFSKCHIVENHVSRLNYFELAAPKIFSMECRFLIKGK